MGKSIPVTIGNLHFSKKGDAISYFKKMLNKYNLGQRVSPDDHDVLLTALATHPDAAEKIEGGMSHFTVKKADFGTRCFWGNRADGSIVKFSYLSCVNG